MRFRLPEVQKHDTNQTYSPYHTENIMYIQNRIQPALSSFALNSDLPYAPHLNQAYASRRTPERPAPSKHAYLKEVMIKLKEAGVTQFHIVEPHDIEDENRLNNPVANPAMDDYLEAASALGLTPNQAKLASLEFASLNLDTSLAATASLTHAASDFPATVQFYNYGIEPIQKLLTLPEVELILDDEEEFTFPGQPQACLILNEYEDLVHQDRELPDWLASLRTVAHHIGVMIVIYSSDMYSLTHEDSRHLLQNSADGTQLVHKGRIYNFDYTERDLIWQAYFLKPGTEQTTPPTLPRSLHPLAFSTSDEDDGQLETYLFETSQELRRRIPWIPHSLTLYTLQHLIPSNILRLEEQDIVAHRLHLLEKDKDKYEAEHLVGKSKDKDNKANHLVGKSKDKETEKSTEEVDVPSNETHTPNLTPSEADLIGDICTPSSSSSVLTDRERALLRNRSHSVNDTLGEVAKAFVPPALTEEDLTFPRNSTSSVNNIVDQVTQVLTYSNPDRKWNSMEDFISDVYDAKTQIEKKSDPDSVNNLVDQVTKVLTSSNPDRKWNSMEEFVSDIYAAKAQIEKKSNPSETAKEKKKKKSNPADWLSRSAYEFEKIPPCVERLKELLPEHHFDVPNGIYRLMRIVESLGLLSHEGGIKVTSQQLREIENLMDNPQNIPAIRTKAATEESLPTTVEELFSDVAKAKAKVDEAKENGESLSSLKPKVDELINVMRGVSSLTSLDSIPDEKLAELKDLANKAQEFLTEELTKIEDLNEIEEGEEIARLKAKASTVFFDDEEDESATSPEEPTSTSNGEPTLSRTDKLISLLVDEFKGEVDTLGYMTKDGVFQISNRKLTRMREAILEAEKAFLEEEDVEEDPTDRELSSLRDKASRRKTPHDALDF